MHVLAVIFGALTFIAVWYYRLKVLGQAARDGKKAIEKIATRQRRFRRLASNRGLRAATDPREAATILMLEMAQARGAMTQKQEAVIRAEIMQHFEFDETDAQALIVQAGRLSHEAGAAQAVISRMTDFILKAPGFGTKELVDLDGMLVYVSEAEGSPTAGQLDLLAIYRQKAGLRV